MNHEAALEIRLVSGLLEDQVLGEVGVVVTHVQPRDEDLLRASDRRDQPNPAGGIASRIADPPDAQPVQLLLRERIGRAGIAPSHIPRVLEEHGLAALLSDLLGEHGAVEGGELILHVLGHVHPLGEPHRSIVGRLDATIPGQREYK